MWSNLNTFSFPVSGLSTRTSSPSVQTTHSSPFSLSLLCKGLTETATRTLDSDAISGLLLEFSRQNGFNTALTKMQNVWSLGCVDTKSWLIARHRRLKILYRISRWILLSGNARVMWARRTGIWTLPNRQFSGIGTTALPTSFRKWRFEDVW